MQQPYMRHPVLYKLFLLAFFLLELLTVPALAHPGSGTPLYMSINLYQITSVTPAPGPSDPSDYSGPIGGSNVIMRISIQHGSICSITSVSVNATEQSSTNIIYGPSQHVLIDGFTQVSTGTSGTGDATVITEIWQRTVDTLNSFKLYNAVYDFKPTVNYSIISASISSDNNSWYAATDIIDRLVTVYNGNAISTDGVWIAVGDSYPLLLKTPNNQQISGISHTFQARVSAVDPSNNVFAKEISVSNYSPGPFTGTFFVTITTSANAHVGSYSADIIDTANPPTVAIPMQTLIINVADIVLQDISFAASATPSIPLREVTNAFKNPINSTKYSYYSYIIGSVGSYCTSTDNNNILTNTYLSTDTSNHYEWARNEPQNYLPAASKQGSSVEIRVDVVGEKKQFLLRAHAVDGKAADCLGGITATQFNLQGNGTACRTNIQLIRKLPAMVTKIQLDWAWEYSMNGGNTWLPTSVTHSLLYSTLGNPPTLNGKPVSSDGLPICWQLYDIGCSSNVSVISNVASNQLAVFNAIWAKFQTRKITRPIITGASDFYTGPICYTYYLYPFEGQSIEYQTDPDDDVATLIYFGHGRCGHFSSFLRDILTAQGLTSSKAHFTIDHTDPLSQLPNYSDILNNMKAFDADLDQHICYRYKLNAPSHAQGGIAQQVRFTDHAMIYYPSKNSPGCKLFDPSYGVPSDSFVGFANFSEWEDKALRTTNWTDGATVYSTIGFQYKQSTHQDNTGAVIAPWIFDYHNIANIQEVTSD